VKPKHLGAALVAATALTLTACGAPDLTSYDDVRAQLNYADGTVTYPLDDYALNAAEALDVERANAVLVHGCMVDFGLDFPRADDEWWRFPPTPDRLFGLWSPEVAELYGYGLPPRDEELAELEAAQPESWWNTYRGCLESTDQLPILTALRGDPNNPSVVDRGWRESVTNTQGSAALQELKAEWVECIAEEGLVAVEGPLLVPELPESVEEQLRIALVDVTCKESLGTMQRLADVLAQYQAAYIDGHESELNDYRDRALAVLDEARQVLATGE
jgi:hypothetical protein